jgi:hypothetical protein
LNAAVLGFLGLEVSGSVAATDISLYSWGI